ncbi:aldo/keto reductase, partial [Klebsiella pneumoniae]
LDRTQVDMVLSYCHYTLHDESLIDLLPYLESKGVGVLNAAPLAMGLLTRQGPSDWHPADPQLRAACAQAARFCWEQGVEIERVALQFALAEP